jgi:hypothetical protein
VRIEKSEKDMSFTLTRNAFRLDGKVLTIAKCDGPIKVVWSRDLPASPSSLTIIRNTSSCSCGRSQIGHGACLSATMPRAPILSTEVPAEA